MARGAGWDREAGAREEHRVVGGVGTGCGGCVGYDGCVLGGAEKGEFSRESVHLFRD